MEHIIVVICVAIWFGLAFLPANTAKKKGHSFAAYYVLSIFFFPVIAFIAHGLPDLNQKQKLFYYESAPIPKPDQLASGTDTNASYEKIRVRYRDTNKQF